MRSSFFALATFGVGLGAAVSSAPRADDAAAIRAARAEQNQAIAVRDFDRVASFWMDDVQVTVGLGLTIRGRAKYRRAFSQDSGIVYHREPDNVEVNSRWPIAWETGTWSGRHLDQSATPLLSGRYSAQWLKQDGRWRIRSELFVALDCSGVACAWPPRLE